MNSQSSMKRTPLESSANSDRVHTEQTFRCDSIQFETNDKIEVFNSLVYQVPGYMRMTAKIDSIAS